MKKSLLALVLGATLTLAACDQANQAKDAAAAKMEDAKAATQDAAKAMADKATEMKDAAATKMEDAKAMTQ
ncbi:hypothetical protein appser10_15050, partial [Actinobacillus pleuropneumoniae serovar 10 str. D13039]